MNNDLANFNVLTGLLVEMATAVKLRPCEPIRRPTKGILYYKYSQESRDLTCWFHNIWRIGWLVPCAKNHVSYFLLIKYYLAERYYR